MGCRKALWVAAKPKQIKPTESISLEENGKIIRSEFFVNAVPNLAVSTNHSFLINTEKENDPIEKAIAKYKACIPACFQLKSLWRTRILFFLFNTFGNFAKTIKTLDPRKVVQPADIPAKLTKR